MADDDPDVLDRVIRTVFKVKEASNPVPLSDITADTPLDEPPLSMDSLDRVSLMVRLEEEFGIIASDEDFTIGSVAAVGDVAQVVNRLLG